MALILSRTIENAQFCPSTVDRFYRDDLAAGIGTSNEAAHVELVAELGTRFA